MGQGSGCKVNSTKEWLVNIRLQWKSHSQGKELGAHRCSLLILSLDLPKSQVWADISFEWRGLPFSSHQTFPPAQVDTSTEFKHREHTQGSTGSQPSALVLLGWHFFVCFSHWCNCTQWNQRTGWGKFLHCYRKEDKGWYEQAWRLLVVKKYMQVLAWMYVIQEMTKKSIADLLHVGLGRLCSHFYPLFYSFIPINFTYYSFQYTYYSQLRYWISHISI